MGSVANEDTAARWLVRRESGAWTEEDERSFNAWLDVSTENRIAYLRVRATWAKAAELKALSAGAPLGTVPPRRWTSGSVEKALPTQPADVAIEAAVIPLRHAPLNKLRLVSALAATFVVCVVGFYALSTGLFAGNRYSTRIGGTDTVTLDDGSRVTLNTDSEIRVDFGSSERRVKLNQGEVFLEVAKDPARPFVVQIRDNRVTAVGTQFSVRRQGESIQVVVTEGAIRIEQSARLPLPTALTGSANPVLVTAGNVAQTADSETIVRAQADGEAERLLSWRYGYVSFDNATLADAVAELNRYSTRQIVIEDASIADIRLSGNFRTNNIEGFLSLLKDGFPVRVQQSDAAVTLRGL